MKIQVYFQSPFTSFFFLALKRKKWKKVVNCLYFLDTNTDPLFLEILGLSIYFWRE